MLWVSTVATNTYIIFNSNKCVAPTYMTAACIKLYWAKRLRPIQSIFFFFLLSQLFQDAQYFYLSFYLLFLSSSFNCFTRFQLYFKHSFSLRKYAVAIQVFILVTLIRFVRLLFFMNINNTVHKNMTWVLNEKGRAFLFVKNWVHTFAYLSMIILEITIFNNNQSYLELRLIIILRMVS